VKKEKYNNDNQEVSLEAAILLRRRNSPLIELYFFDNV